jgi:hypothetical protein
VVVDSLGALAARLEGQAPGPVILRGDEQRAAATAAINQLREYLQERDGLTRPETLSVLRAMDARALSRLDIERGRAER